MTEKKHGQRTVSCSSIFKAQTDVEYANTALHAFIHSAPTLTDKEFRDEAMKAANSAVRHLSVVESKLAKLRE